MKKAIKKIKGMAIFEGRKIRRIWDEKQEKWFFRKWLQNVTGGMMAGRRYYFGCLQPLTIKL